MSEIDKSVMQDPQTSEVAGHRPVPLATECEQRVRQQRENWRWLLKLAIQPLLFLSAGALLIAGLGTAQRLGWMSAGGTAGHKQVANSDKNAQYICPMMCTPPQPEPGRCPVCGMELVSTSSGAAGGDSRSIQIDPAARRLANIQTVAVKSIPLMRSIRAIGELSYDEGTLKTISAYVDGRIEKLYADYTGVVVTKGDRLALLYSPQLYSGQVELLLAKKAHDDQQNVTLRRVIESNAELYESARQRLLELGMTGPQIDEIEATGQANSRMYLHAPISGTVIERFAVEGEYVKEGKVIFRLAGLSTVWLMLELFPEDAANIHYGQIVNTRVQSLPGREFTGRVAFIDPNVDPKTRTVGVRVVMPNEDGLLRVGDYANATICVAAGHEGGHSIAVYDPELARKWISPRHPHVIESSPGKCRVCGVDLVPASQFGFSDEPVAGDVALVVPRQAVLMAGTNSVVYVETESGRFEIRRVVLGPNVGQQTVVLEGVREGELVASSGNFLDRFANAACRQPVVDRSDEVTSHRDG